MEDLREGAIDAHTHPFSGDIPSFVREMDHAGVAQSAALFSLRDPADIDRPDVRRRISLRLSGELASRREAIFDQMRRYINGLANPTNADSARLAREYPGRFLPFGSVHMHAPPEELDRELDELGALHLYGVKLLPTLQLFKPSESPNFERVCDWCEKNRKVIIYHTWCDPGPFEIPEVADDANPKHLEPVLERYSPRIVLAHFGAYSAYYPGLWFDEAMQILKRFDAACADTSAAVHFLTREKNLTKIKKEVGFERVLFGTDYPVVGGSSMSAEADIVRSSPFLSEQEKRMVMRENAVRVLNL